MNISTLISPPPRFLNIFIYLIHKYLGYILYIQYSQKLKFLDFCLKFQNTSKMHYELEGELSFDLERTCPNVVLALTAQHAVL